ncbi:hypothetical protein LX32DRAFT_65513 [Colletotrichum zoysiae]|uniref:Uncharacterized protein n=1 Tax=Colletotrichum zoysiae TaxID=1216348 RepID=A0AAD9LY95_9PEZI|nr:hypothetical protein LX32DRAFT_65513 [Colletotrichum zoysiae]
MYPCGPRRAAGQFSTHCCQYLGLNACHTSQPEQTRKCGDINKLFVLFSNCPSILQDRSQKKKPQLGHPPLTTGQFSMLPVISHVRMRIKNPKHSRGRGAALLRISSIKKRRKKTTKKRYKKKNHQAVTVHDPSCACQCSVILRRHKDIEENVN